MTEETKPPTCAEEAERTTDPLYRYGPTFPARCGKPGASICEEHLHARIAAADNRAADAERRAENARAATAILARLVSERDLLNARLQAEIDLAIRNEPPQASFADQFRRMRK